MCIRDSLSAKSFLVFEAFTKFVVRNVLTKRLMSSRRERMIAAVLELSLIHIFPLIGHGLPCIFDEKLLEFDSIFGGTGNEWVTLKISSKDVRRLNHIVASLF